MPATRDPLISAAQLKDMISDTHVRVVDATWVPPFLKQPETGRDKYKAAHILGAVYFDIDDIADQDTDLKHMLPDPDRFSAKVSELGLSNHHRIVVYDTGGFFASARVWWMFRAMGHEDVCVLDGGLQAWLASGGETEATLPVTGEGNFSARKRDDLVKDMTQMQSVVAGAATAILDARPAGRFTAEAPEPRAGLPSGHMPGSRSVPSSGLIDNGFLRSAKDLKPILSEGLDQPAIASCGSGVSAAIIALARARLGQFDTAIYDGSWSEWASHASNPIATGS